jgi:Na+/H+ antiporter NhaC
MDQQTIEAIAQAVAVMIPAAEAAPAVVPSWDATLSAFIGQNWITISAALLLLKGIAKVTPWAWDDSVASLFAGIIPMFRPGYNPKPDKIPDSARNVSGEYVGPETR